MKTKNTLPQTLVEAVRYFADQDVALEFMVGLRWPEGVVCPHCGSKSVRFIRTRRVWECSQEHKQRRFSIKTGTVMEESPLSLDKWLIAIWLEANTKNSTSSYEVARALGITQKSAWFLQQRIRLAMQSGNFFRKLSGEVEVDETFALRLPRCIFRALPPMKGRGAIGKAVVMGLLERHGEVRTKVVCNTKRLAPFSTCSSMTGLSVRVFTDALPSYVGLTDYAHKVIDHAECYAKGNIHTNGLENFWALFKRCIKGTHVSIEPFHLFRYLDAECFRFNTRKQDDGQRFVRVVSQMSGKRLKYKDLIGEGEELLAIANDAANVTERSKIATTFQGV